jgi:tetratricopeptide (TPR) repeat protein
VSRPILCLLLLLAAPLRADEVDPDTERAQRLFAEGAAAYETRDYALALERMEAARRLRPSPAFDYNIARCHDRIGHDAEALVAYERFLAASPGAPEAVDVRSRIAVLRARVTPASASRPARPRRYVAAGVMTGVALALLGTGAGLAGSVPGDYRALDERWRREGPSNGVPDAAEALRARDYAGTALLVAGGVAAAVDIVLWVLAARRGRGAHAALPLIRF